MKKAVHFGAGNIGRGFIGLLLHQAGYEVVFVDVNQELVEELRSRQSYQVQLAMEGAPQTTVAGVTAIDGRDENAVADAIAIADLVTTAVGPHVLPHIASAIAQGISRRIKGNQRALNVIACENMIGGSEHLKQHVSRFLQEEEQSRADQLVGFPNAAVDRIVPLQQHEDKLLVTVEPFFEWVVDQSQVIGELPHIEGITYVDSIWPYIERKLFTVNTGHAVIAYLGYQKGIATIHESMKDDFILKAVRGALEETGALLEQKHGFDKDTQDKYREKILERFTNPMLADRVTRVGRSPIRKLSPNDRLVGPAMQCVEKGIVPEYLGLAIAAALRFDDREDAEAVIIQQDIEQSGLKHALHKHTNIPEGHPLEEIVLRYAASL